RPTPSWPPMSFLDLYHGRGAFEGTLADEDAEGDPGGSGPLVFALPGGAGALAGGLAMGLVWQWVWSGNGSGTYASPSGGAWPTSRCARLRGCPRRSPRLHLWRCHPTSLPRSTARGSGGSG